MQAKTRQKTYKRPPLKRLKGVEKVVGHTVEEHVEGMLLSCRKSL